MRIPYYVDNEEHRLADVLNQVLAEHAGRSLDVASAYFTVGRYNDFLHHPAIHGGELIASYTVGLNTPSSPEVAKREN